MRSCWSSKHVGTLLFAFIWNAYGFLHFNSFRPWQVPAIGARRFSCAAQTSAARLLATRCTHKNPTLFLSRENGDEPENKIASDIRRAFLASAAAALTYNIVGAVATPPGFRRVPTQFIAALGDPDASSGTGAETWGVWPVDPGPRGVPLGKYSELEASGGRAAAGWVFDKEDWWLEEHGLIMEAPDFPLVPGRYLVTGGRLVTTVLTILPPDSSGATGWSLGNGKLYDVTHLPCRAARYQPNSAEGSPAMAKRSDFPVVPGAAMPSVDGCNKQDYAVLFVIGKEG
mmetsp:Transcript_7544/g.13695  ORF Transcript_7544/g.13695 Transcript_7544/m.13695 type:complete len:286 (-) Transcript_7544:144-1001(-)|eukprot:CAMPEP_0197459478 /NCGR_PEP_ID=MMETSP1175-20131217/51559_1 /TAXON_ID=1003142 /ORGANISM="Triceratium dubium, Strain CCMP147" /LENGTH=285 /DNA_ID=CAMNT_0042994369 /DNA_START=5 /DNA_END=862 /DNA_ORIENTATION=+